MLPGHGEQILVDMHLLAHFQGRLGYMVAPENHIGRHRALRLVGYGSHRRNCSAHMNKARDGGRRFELLGTVAE